MNGLRTTQVPAAAQPRAFNPIVRARSEQGKTAVSDPSRLHAPLGNQGVQRALLTNLGIQPKLTVNEPGDAYEEEADRVADTVMRMEELGTPPAVGPSGDGVAQRMCTACAHEHEHVQETGSGKPALQRACAECEREQEKKLHRKPAGGTAEVPTVTSDVESRIGSLRGSGSALSPQLREFLEPRFNRGFGGVRVHTGGQAADTSRAVSARAFTVGRDIVFGPGEFSPHTSGGLRLLAHELTHVVQQGEAGDQLQRMPPSTSRALGAVTVRRTVGKPAVQRQATAATAPTGMPCVLTVGPSHLTGTDVIFPMSSSDVPREKDKDLDDVVARWKTGGSRDDVTVDGYASTDGPESINWPLSCTRAEAVKVALVARGIPAGKIVTFAHGESTQFSRRYLRENRRAVIRLQTAVSPTPAPVTPPASVCPAVPAVNPGSCAARNTAYCDAGACQPTNSWLNCVCVASAEVCRAADAFRFEGSEGQALAACALAEGAPPTPIADKGFWFQTTNACIWRHWRGAFEAIHDPARPVPPTLTPEWAVAVSACRAKGLGSKDCCEAHVEAEQHAIDRCGPYDSTRFGTSPSAVPGSIRCSAIVSALTPGPTFTGDFGQVVDRIAYGKARCCP